MDENINIDIKKEATDDILEELSNLAPAEVLEMYDDMTIEETLELLDELQEVKDGVNND